NGEDVIGRGGQHDTGLVQLLAAPAAAVCRPRLSPRLFGPDIAAGAGNGGEKVRGGFPLYFLLWGGEAGGARGLRPWARVGGAGRGVWGARGGEGADGPCGRAPAHEAVHRRVPGVAPPRWRHLPERPAAALSRGGPARQPWLVPRKKLAPISRNSRP